MTRPIHVAIMGTSGYGAGELLRLLTQHPDVEVVSATSTSQVGQRIADVHPHLRGFYGLEISAAIDYGRLLDAEHSVVFSALPHGVSAMAIELVLDEVGQRREAGTTGGASEEHCSRAVARMRVVDLSGDLRLATESVHQRHYPETTWNTEQRAMFAYGLPELNRETIGAARCVANPGCLASASILAAAPLATADFTGTLAIDAKTGSSGSGRQLKATTHHPTRHSNFRAYSPLAHRHEPEILQALGDPLGQRVHTSFVAQSLDTTRGIFITAHATLADESDTTTLLKRYADFYADSPFVRVVDASPELQNVVGSNFCEVSVACRGRQVIAMAALDNLVKGMSGTAIQNMNLMCGLPETTGLWMPAPRPV